MGANAAGLATGSAVKYVSTRGRAPALGFDDVLLSGLAADGGLFVPDAWPAIDPKKWQALAGLDYAALAAEIMAPFVVGSSAAAALKPLTNSRSRAMRSVWRFMFCIRRSPVVTTNHFPAL